MAEETKGACDWIALFLLESVIRQFYEDSFLETK